MTPEERAKYLLDKFDGCKGYALLCVAEILHQVAGAKKKVEGSNYWSQVKWALEKL